MNNKTKRKSIICITAAVALAVGVCAGCGSGSASDGTDATQETEIVFGDNTVAVVGGEEITLDEFNIYVKELKLYYQQYLGSDEGWENIVQSSGLTAKDEILEQALDYSHMNNTILAKAKKEGVFTNADIEEYYNSVVANYGGEESYKEQLDYYGFTDEAFKKYSSCEGAYYAWMETICSTDEEAAKIYDSEGLTAQHVLIQFSSNDSEDAAYDKAMEVYNKAVNGADFDELITQYNEDPGQGAGDSYTFVDGEMVQEFYNGTKALEIGEISEPIKTSYGYHVIKRCPMPELSDEEYAEKLENVKQVKRNAYLSEDKLKELMEEFPISVNDDILESYVFD